MNGLITEEEGISRGKKTQCCEGEGHLFKGINPESRFDRLLLHLKREVGRLRVELEVYFSFLSLSSPLLFLFVSALFCFPSLPFLFLVFLGARSPFFMI